MHLHFFFRLLLLSNTITNSFSLEFSHGSMYIYRNTDNYRCNKNFNMRLKWSIEMDDQTTFYVINLFVQMLLC